MPCLLIIPPRAVLLAVTLTLAPLAVATAASSSPSTDGLLLAQADTAATAPARPPHKPAKPHHGPANGTPRGPGAGGCGSPAASSAIAGTNDGVPRGPGAADEPGCMSHEPPPQGTPRGPGNSAKPAPDADSADAEDADAEDHDAEPAHEAHPGHEPGQG